MTTNGRAIDGVVGGAEGEIDGTCFIGPIPSTCPSSGEMRVSFKDYMWMLSKPDVEQPYVKMGHPSG